MGVRRIFSWGWGNRGFFPGGGTIEDFFKGSHKDFSMVGNKRGEILFYSLATKKKLVLLNIK